MDMTDDNETESRDDHVDSGHVTVIWQNEAGSEIDLYWVTSDGREHFAVSVPPAARRSWPSEYFCVFFSAAF